MRATGGCAWLFDCQAASYVGVATSQKDIGPCSVAGPGGCPSCCPFAPPKNRGGWRADKAHGLDYSRPAREFRGSRASPDTPGPGVKRHPRALRRATEHLRAYALPTVGPHQELFVPGGLFPRSPVGEVASALPAGALPLPALRTSPEDAPRRVDRDGDTLAEFHQKGICLDIAFGKIPVICRLPVGANGDDTAPNTIDRLRLECETAGAHSGLRFG